MIGSIPRSLGLIRCLQCARANAGSPPVGEDVAAATLCGLTLEELATEQQQGGTVGEPPQAVAEHGEDELLRVRERFLPAASFRAAPMDGLSLIDASDLAKNPMELGCKDPNHQGRRSGHNWPPTPVA